VLFLFLEKDAAQWVLHGGCLNEVGNLYGGSEWWLRSARQLMRRWFWSVNKKTRRMRRQKKGKKSFGSQEGDC